MVRVTEGDGDHGGSRGDGDMRGSAAGKDVDLELRRDLYSHPGPSAYPCPDLRQLTS